MGFALDSAMRQNVKVSMIPFEKMKKRDFTFHLTELKR